MQARETRASQMRAREILMASKMRARVYQIVPQMLGGGGGDTQRDSEREKEIMVSQMRVIGSPHLTSAQKMGVYLFLGRSSLPPSLSISICLSLE
jgi:hypothetical protein